TADASLFYGTNPPNQQTTENNRLKIFFKSVIPPERLSLKHVVNEPYGSIWDQNPPVCGADMLARCLILLRWLVWLAQRVKPPSSSELGMPSFCHPKPLRKKL
ncbi:hypothetical protein, partial [Neisseria shayeganii]|uniref:hypothetical protein n=1 Tax=Neisseria shayeganii TaxID=607712 RepID=UPI0018DB4DC9